MRSFIEHTEVTRELCAHIPTRDMNAHTVYTISNLAPLCPEGGNETFGLLAPEKPRLSGEGGERFG